MGGLKNNQLVQQGDTLLRLSSESIDTDRENTLKTLGEQQRLLVDLEHLQSEKFSKLQTPSLQEEYRAYRSSYSELASKVEHARVALERNQKLFEAHTISKVEYEGFYYSYQQSVNSLQNLKSKHFSDWNNQSNYNHQRKNNFT